MSINKREYYSLTGPMNLSHLPDHIISLFRDSYDLPDSWQFSDVEPNPNGSIDWLGQVPVSLHPYLNTLKGGAWAREIIDTGICAAREDIDSITPVHYPNAGKMIRDAINKIPSLDKNSKILIGGSVSPWIESICLANQFTNITTSDYEVRKVEDDRIKFVHANELGETKFDLIISFSSIEHDGLGRYGDPINPYGPFNAVDEFHESLNNNGCLLCGIPVLPEEKKQQPSLIQGHCHVIFSRKSVEKLFRKFKMIDVINQPDGWDHLWQHQPIYILQKQ
jgi:hypothetical protein